MRGLASALTFAVSTTLAVAQQAENLGSGRLRTISVSVSDVFDDETAAERSLANLVNRVHWETREEVVRREIWLRPGDVVTVEQAAELERNLRSLGLFAEVQVRLVPVGDGEQVDLEVVTKDRLTLNFGAGASLVGGVTRFSTNVGESNLLGYGNRVNLSFSRNSEDEFRGRISYTDLHVLDSWHVGRVSASRTDDGDSFALSLRRPFKHLADPRGYGIVVRHDETGVDYYRGGDSLAEVLVTQNSISGDLTWASGPETARRFAGFVLSVDEREYEPATGPLAPAIRVPGTTHNVFLGVQSRWNWIDGYRKVVGLDTIDYVQDLALGLFFGGSLGARWRDEDAMGGDLQPQASADVRWAAEPWTDVFVDLTARGSLRWDGGRAAAWSSSAGGWLFAFTGDSNVIGINAVYDIVEENQDLPLELTLGEDNGLRGYPSREFSGSARARVNVENRFDTGLEIATLRFGTVVFGDVGWIGTESNLGRPYRSAGVGLRIGSRSLLGSGVVRIDLAKPFDDVIGESDGWKVSLSLGQVIRFGGNAR